MIVLCHECGRLLASVRAYCARPDDVGAGLEADELLGHRTCAARLCAGACEAQHAERHVELAGVRAASRGTVRLAPRGIGQGGAR